jgi:hypothetical protein
MGTLSFQMLPSSDSASIPRIYTAGNTRSAPALRGAISWSCVTRQPRLSSQARAACSTMDSVKLFTTQVPPWVYPESRHFGGMLGGIRRHMEAAGPYPDTLSGLLSGFPLSPA